MGNNENILPQESPSVYFNNIIRKNVEPVNVDMLSPEVLADFNAKVMEAFGDDGETTVRRIRYLVPYILQAIDWDEYGIPLEVWQLQYYYHRERFLAKTHLSHADFKRHQPLQDAIAALRLQPEPTFEFILFLKYYYDLRSDLHYSPIEILRQARGALESMPENAEASIDINVNGRHYKISGRDAVMQIVGGVDTESLRKMKIRDDFTHGGNRDKLRALDYFIVKTLLDYLPIRRDAHRRGLYCQDERNFGLSVLSLCGRLPDIDREGGVLEGKQCYFRQADA